MLRSKIMSRSIALVMLILLIFTCGCLAGCEDNTSEGEYQFPDPYDMPRKLRRAAEEAYAEYDEVEEFGEWDTPGDGILGDCFYGNYNGAVVIKSVGNLGHLPFCLGGYVFDSGEAMILKVYYEGKIMDIADAYAGGIISSDDITKIAEIHTNHVWADMPQMKGISFAYPCDDCRSGNYQDCEYLCQCRRDEHEAE